VLERSRLPSSPWDGPLPIARPGCRRARRTVCAARRGRRDHGAPEARPVAPFCCSLGVAAASCGGRPSARPPGGGAAGFGGGCRAIGGEERGLGQVQC
jgi:hypothetical protein